MDLILRKVSSPVTPSVAQRSRGALDFAWAERGPLLRMRTRPSGLQTDLTFSFTAAYSLKTMRISNRIPATSAPGALVSLWQG